MMKRLTIMALLLATAFTAMAQKTSITGTVTGLADGARLVLSEPQGGRLVPTDTLRLDAKGRYKVERQTADEVFFILSLNQQQTPMVHVLLLPGEKVTMDIVYRLEHNFLQITSVKGSENMAMYQQYNNMVYQAAGDPARQAAMPSAIEALIRQYSTELMSAFLVTYFESSFEQYYDLYKTVRDGTKPRYPNHDFVKHVDQKVNSVVAIGSVAPDIELPDPEGKMRRLSDLRGKVVLLDFWASWCRPCRMENPNVVRLYHQYKDKGFEVFSVSLDNNRDGWLNAIKSDGLIWPNHVSDLRGWSSAGGRQYGIMSIPATVLIDREGRVLARNLRGQQLEQTLKELFAE